MAKGVIPPGLAGFLAGKKSGPVMKGPSSLQNAAKERLAEDKKKKKKKKATVPVVADTAMDGE